MTTDEPTLRFGRQYEERVSLADGRNVVLRLVQPSDKPLLRDGFERLSDTSRYRRFHAPKRTLTDAEVKYLTEIDGDRHFALGAVEVAADGTQRGVGIARFIRLPDAPDCAEAAIAVLDEMQGKGLGRILLRRLVAAAVERGVRQFYGEVLAENAAMRALFDEVCPEGRQQWDGNVLHMLMELPTPEQLREDEAHAAPTTSALYRLMKLVARGAVVLRRALVRTPDDERDA